ncbi:hypothetical protein WCE41_00865 [Luteimonas sp. MJ246]|uniref:hypothetical protein n=1 Tax=Luteimonas sp. MJ174 TaxID=3129237 RepID=UPI0031B9B10F
MHKTILLFLLALPLSATALANTSADATNFAPDKGLDLNSGFHAQRDAIIAALRDGETYSDISDEDARVVQESLLHIASLLGDAQTVKQLPDATRVRVFNEQERINTLLGRAHADSRMVCRREKATGSNMSTNVCMTVGDRRRATDSAKDFLRYNPRAMGNNPNGM